MSSRGDDAYKASGASVVGDTLRSPEEAETYTPLTLDLILDWPDELRYWGGMSAVEEERLGEAVIFFRSIPRQSRFYRSACQHLARCYTKLGHYEAALERMLSVLPELEGDEYVEVAAAVAHTFSFLGMPDRMRHYQDLAASARIAYRNLQPQMDELDHTGPMRLEQNQFKRQSMATALPSIPPDYFASHLTSSLPRVTPDENTEAGVTYDLLSYMRYEYASRADAAKKNLEMCHAKRAILRSRELDRRSLDIGCATGRYPLWLASEGFSARGYDVSEQAIEICKKRTQNSEFSDRVAFERRDIVQDGVADNYYDLITLMMGTFNHIHPRERTTLLERCYGALREGGRLVLSCWNPSCSYLGMLSIYTPQDRATILNNSLPATALMANLDNAGFVEAKVSHFCFLPDVCYDAWSHQVPEHRLCQLDMELSRFIGDQDAQMYMLTARKRSHKRARDGGSERQP